MEIQTLKYSYYSVTVFTVAAKIQIKTPNIKVQLAIQDSVDRIAADHQVQSFAEVCKLHWIDFHRMYSKIKLTQTFICLSDNKTAHRTEDWKFQNTLLLTISPNVHNSNEQFHTNAEYSTQMHQT